MLLLFSSEAKYRTTIQGEGIKILTSTQISQRFSIDLVQIRSLSKHLFNALFKQKNYKNT